MSEIIATLFFKNISQQRISGLDGIRGFAVLFVLGAHTKFISLGFGATGVWMFFILSGYLLSDNLINQYRQNNRRIFNATIEFYVKRFFRIIPVYFIVLLFYCFIIWSGNMNILLKHYTFTEAIWLFWTLKTELLFYILLPFILTFLFSLTKDKYNLIFLSLLLLLLGYFLTEYKIVFTLSLAQIGKQWPFYITPFLIGILITFMHVDLDRRLRVFIFYSSFFVVLILTIDYSPIVDIRTFFYSDGIQLPWRDRLIVYIFVSILIVSSIGSSFWLLENRFIKTIGKLSFSFYLWHTLILILLRKYFLLNGLELFLLSLPIIFFISVFSFHLLELPFHNLGKFISNKLIARRKV